ncbi:DUF2125 domain-containing protein [Salipiger sp. PrR002]|uniref:DUF2125 domain-containing protein n=1 Tax=Salipiger sp. PrR002 TaxID=2706489 RepID=UPI0013BE3227|nr:DUF2125 domain-containing protein [Salipiger sp. PrR002]NDV99089.1 DUF2125 domain-containing protein [Salipiger sp. PrR002]NDW56042.1 DUF2125 domain-containing protein [Salipiger sp. PrR004]
MRVLTGVMGAGVAALALTPPALADVTPEQVWDDLSGMLEGVGYEVSVTESPSGGNLLLSDLTLTMAVAAGEAQAAGDVTVAFGDLTFEDLGDGTVGIRFPSPMPIDIRVTEEGAEPVEMTLELGQEALEMIASGTPEAMDYSYSAAATSLDLVRLVAEGEELPREVISASLATGPLSGSSEVDSSDGTRRYSHSYKTDELRYDLSGSNPEEENATGQISGRMTGLASSGMSVIPDEMGSEDAAAFMAAGFEGNGRFTYETGQASFAVTQDGETMTGSSSSKGGSFEGSIDGTHLSYALSLDTLNYEAEGSSLPFPVSAAMDKVAYNMTLPLAKSDTPQDLALGLTLGGLTVSDQIWGIFDPGGSLPRDPATLAFDITGKATPLVSIFDPADLAQLEGEETAPAELNALSLNSLTLEVAGAKITGEGDFTFHNEDTESYGGMPRPEGAVNFTLAGANGLIDKLIAMGLLSQQDAMGARMMLGMFTVAGSEPDTMTSTIEVDADGHLLANGQRIR